MNKKTEKTLIFAVFLGMMWVGAGLPGVTPRFRKRIKKAYK